LSAIYNIHWSHLDDQVQHSESSAMPSWLYLPELYDSGLKAIELIKQGRKWPNHILISNYGHQSSVVAK